jgi:hypothetical protein
LAEDVPAGDALAGDVPAGDALAGDALVARRFRDLGALAAAGAVADSV